MDLYKVFKRCLCRSSKTLKDLRKFFTRARYPTFEQLGPEIHANSTFFGEKLISSFCLFISVFFIRVTTNDHKKSNTCTTLYFKMYKVVPKKFLILLQFRALINDNFGFFQQGRQAPLTPK